MKGGEIMSTKLENLFANVLDGTEQVLKKTEPYDHPLLTLTRESLKEQKENLEKLLPKLKEDEEEAELEKVKEHITIVYHDHEIAEPLFRSWKRASDWMDLPSKSVTGQIEPLFEKMKKDLEDAAVELEEIYGDENIKFVVPSFYNPVIR